MRACRGISTSFPSPFVIQVLFQSLMVVTLLYSFVKLFGLLCYICWNRYISCCLDANAHLPGIEQLLNTNEHTHTDTLTLSHSLTLSLSLALSLIYNFYLYTSIHYIDIL